MLPVAACRFLNNQQLWRHFLGCVRMFSRLVSQYKLRVQALARTIVDAL